MYSNLQLLPGSIHKSFSLSFFEVVLSEASFKSLHFFTPPPFKAGAEVISWPHVALVDRAICVTHLLLWTDEKLQPSTRTREGGRQREGVCSSLATRRQDLQQHSKCTRSSVSHSDTSLAWLLQMQRALIWGIYHHAGIIYFRILWRGSSHWPNPESSARAKTLPALDVTGANPIRQSR